MSFREIQTRTGWARTLEEFADWCAPQTGWKTLDVGCGPGFFPALLQESGCLAYGADLDFGVFSRPRLHTLLVQADVYHLPFPTQTFDMVTASNILFLLDQPARALIEIARLVRQGGMVALLNPSEHMTIAGARSLADQHHLKGLARESLLNWAQRAEAGYRWDVSGLEQLFTQAGLKMIESRLSIGPGLARFTKGIRLHE